MFTYRHVNPMLSEKKRTILNFEQIKKFCKITLVRDGQIIISRDDEQIETSGCWIRLL